MNFLVPQLFSRIVALALIGTVMFTGVGTSCLIPAATAHSPMAGCHPVHVPSHPQSAGYRCCGRRPTAALLTHVVLPRPPLQTLEADALGVLIIASRNHAFPALITPSGGPPGVVVLRI
jgi:hypothetical protein